MIIKGIASMGGGHIGLLSIAWWVSLRCVIECNEDISFDS